MKNPACFIASVMLSLPVFAQGKIDQSKKELNANSGVSHSSSSASPSRNNNSSDTDENSLGFQLFKFTLGGVYLLAVGDYKHEPHLNHYITPYPFYNRESGNYEGYDTIRKKGIRFDVDERFMYNNRDLYGNHLKAKIRPFQYFYVKADYHQLFERNNNTTDELSLFYFNLCYDRIRFERFNLGWNLGASYVGNNVGKGGFSYGLSADYFFKPQWSLSSAITGSKINGQPVNAFEIGGKYHVKSVAFWLGYERLKIATPHYNFITAGAGIYF